MPTAGLSLVGFMPREAAIRHLREACVAPDPSDAALEAEWLAAQAKLGAPFANAGHPEILDLPAEASAHMAAVAAGWPEFFAQANPVFRLVEIAPLLAYQFIVDGPRSDQHCEPFSAPPTLDELLVASLPTAPTQEDIHSQQLAQSVVLSARSLNVRMVAQGMIAPGIFGMQIDLSLPFVHVVKFNDRCYLHNGYHRAYSAAIQGATHIPCLYREVGFPASAGIKDDGTTFPLALLESDNAPTLAHFSQARAHTVAIRATRRILHISWAEYGMYDE